MTIRPEELWAQHHKKAPGGHRFWSSCVFHTCLKEDRQGSVRHPSVAPNSNFLTRYVGDPFGRPMLKAFAKQNTWSLFASQESPKREIAQVYGSQRGNDSMNNCAWAADPSNVKKQKSNHLLVAVKECVTALLLRVVNSMTCIIWRNSLLVRERKPPFLIHRKGNLRHLATREYWKLPERVSMFSQTNCICRNR